NCPPSLSGLNSGPLRSFTRLQGLPGGHRRRGRRRRSSSRRSLNRGSCLLFPKSEDLSTEKK
ncbi:unnamed protein product, partial [Linum tenue]